jgi:pimeloyl-ACP methyl ester carboxylesterase
MMHYKITGQGQPVVLVHGFPNDGSAWDNIVPALSAKYKLIIPDLPGAGQSALPPALSLELMADGLKAILDKEDIRKAILAGHSMGGYTSLQFAVQFPERVQGISLVHALASADNAGKKENRRKAIALMSKGIAEQEMFLKGMAQNLFSESFAKARPEVVKSIIERGMRLSTASLIAFYQAIMNRSDKQELLSGFGFPVQWIIGDEDTATPMKEALQQCHLSQISKVSVYSPCGHMSMEECPERLSADLLSFFDFCYA